MHTATKMPLTTLLIPSVVRKVELHNPVKVFPHTMRHPIVGIIVDIDEKMFSIPGDKLDEISQFCNKMFLRYR